MMAGCYTLDLYCDNEAVEHPHDEFPHQFIAETGGECRSKARRRGWLLSRDRQICPTCSGKKPAPEPKSEHGSLAQLAARIERDAEKGKRGR